MIGISTLTTFPCSPILEAAESKLHLTVYRRLPFGRPGGRDAAALGLPLDGMVEASNTVTLDLSILRDRRDWVDCSAFVIAYDPLAHLLSAPVNLYAETYLGRSRFGELAARNGENYPLILMVPHRGVTSLSECGIHLNACADLPPLCPAGTVEQEAQATRDAVMPHLEFQGPAEIPAGGYADVDVLAVGLDGTPFLPPLTVQLETTAGYLPKTRLTTRNGSARFKVGALGLEPGDVFKVKGGFRLFSGADEIAFTVS